MKKIKSIWSDHKEKHQKNQEKEQASAFNITEKNGIIYVTAGVRAIRTIDKNMTASDIVKVLEDCRKAQINFIKDK